MTFALQTSLLRVGMGSEARGEISVAFRRDKCGIHDASAHRIPRVGDATAETTIALGPLPESSLRTVVRGECVCGTQRAHRTLRWDET